MIAKTDLENAADALNAAIARAWQVFDLSVPATTGVCAGCCMDPEIEADFLGQPARSLPADYIRDWYFAAAADDIGHDHVAWFLPRVMEMLATGEEVASAGDETVFQRLPLTGFPDLWPATEVESVNRFALAFLELKIEQRKTQAWLDTALCMFGQGGIDVRPLLARLEALDDASLAGFLHADWVQGRVRSIPVNPFWNNTPTKNKVLDWYTSVALSRRMKRAALAGNERALEIHELIAAQAG